MAMGFSPPSRRACASVLRDCVRRHGRLPEWIMVDQGSDFRSVYFETWLAEQEITKQERPTGAPRWGGSLERTYGVAKQELYGTLPGNAVNKKIIRSVSPSHRPRATATLTLFDIYKMTERYFFGTFNKHARGKATKAPEILRKEGLKHYSCSGIVIDYDDKFLISTALPAPMESYRIDPQRGVNIDGRWYKCPALFSTRALRVVGPRIEPWNDSVAYLPIDGRWNVAHIASIHESFGGDALSRMCESTSRGDVAELFKELKEARDNELAELADKNAKHGARAKADIAFAPTSAQPKKARPRHKAFKFDKPLKPLPLKFRRVA